MKDLGLCDYFDETKMGVLRDGTCYTVDDETFEYDKYMADSALENVINRFKKCLLSFKNDFNIKFYYFKEYSYYVIGFDKEDITEEKEELLCIELRKYLREYNLDFY